MAEFNEYYVKLSIAEGGYANVKNDKGGETYAGITRKWFPDWCGWAIIDNFEKTIMVMRHNQHLKMLDKPVKQFYKKEFWDKIKGDSLENQELAEQVCDFAVTSGIRTSIKILQKEYNWFNYLSIEVDGIIGSETIKAVNSTDNCMNEISSLCDMFTIERIRYYKDLCKNDKTQKKFLLGWIDRVLEL